MGTTTSSGTAGNINAAIGGVSDRTWRDNAQGGSWYTESSKGGGGSYGKTTFGEYHNPEIGGSRERRQEQQRVTDITSPGGYMDQAHASYEKAKKDLEEAEKGVDGAIKSALNFKDKIFLNREGLYDTRTVYELNPMAMFAGLVGGPAAGFIAKHVTEDLLGAEPIDINVTKIGETYDDGRDFVTRPPSDRVSKTQTSTATMTGVNGKAGGTPAIATGNTAEDFTKFFDMIKTAFPSIDFTTLPDLTTLPLPEIDLTTTLDTINTLSNNGTAQQAKNPIPVERPVRTPTFGSE